MCIRDSYITIHVHVHVGSSDHVLGYGDGATAPSSRGPLQSIAAKRNIANVENELMEIEESEQDRESMSQSDNSDTGSDEDPILCLSHSHGGSELTHGGKETEQSSSGQLPLMVRVHKS